MAVSLTHSTVVVVADDGTSPVGTDEWNAGHTLTQATGKLLGRTTASTGPVEEITPSADFNFASTALAMKNLTALGQFVVTAYGATTGATDNSAAFQAAIDAAYAAGGGIVLVPAGTWNFTAQVLIKAGVMVRGVGWAYEQNVTTPTLGTILAIKWGTGAGADDDVTKAAFVMNDNSYIQDLIFFYPDQARNDFTPTVYGATIKLYEGTAYNTKPYLNNVNIHNILFLRCTVGVDARGTSAGPYYGGTNDYKKLINHCRFSKLKIAATFRGVRVNEVYDWTILDDIEVQAGLIGAAQADYALDASLRDYAQKNCVAFELGRCDWLKMNSCTAWAVLYGCLIQGNGPFTLVGCEFDACRGGCIIFDTTGGATYFKAIGCTFTAFDALEDAWYSIDYSGTRYSGYACAITNGSVLRDIAFDSCTLFGPSKGWFWAGNASQTVVRLGIRNCNTYVSNVAGGADYAVNAGSGGVSDIIVTNNFFEGLGGSVIGTVGGTTTNTGNII